MGYRYLDDFRRGISVFAIFSYCIAVLGTPQCPPRRKLGIFILYQKCLFIYPNKVNSPPIRQCPSFSVFGPVTSDHK